MVDQGNEQGDLRRGAQARPQQSEGGDHVHQPTPSPRDPIIRLENVSKSFGALQVLDGITLEIARGETTVIIGPSGTGKSVLLKHIVGLLKPDRGAVWVESMRVDQLSESQLVDVRMKIGFLFQMGALFDSMTVEQNLCFPLAEHMRIPAAQRVARCQAVLELVGLTGIEQKMPGDLSGGQRKRVALARAIVLEPQIVLYDEPTTGLDPMRAGVINELIISLSKRLGITSIVVTHDMASANKIADRIVMLYDGRIIADAPTSNFADTDNDLVQRFIHGRTDDADLDRIRDTHMANR